MTNLQVVKAFLDGQRGHSLNMTTDGEKLWSYNTVIAQHHTASYGGLIVNMTRYSSTTSKQRNYVIRELGHSDFTTVDGIGMGAFDLAL